MEEEEISLSLLPYGRPGLQARGNMEEEIVCNRWKDLAGDIGDDGVDRR